MPPARSASPTAPPATHRSPGGRSRRHASCSASCSSRRTSTSSTRPAPRSTRCSSTTSTRRSSKATPEGEISPGLASLEISEDGLTYTLTLQEGVTFHDGDPLTASDVVWSLEQLRRRGRQRGGDARPASRRSRRTDDLDRGAHAHRAGQRPRLQPQPPCRRRAQRGRHRPRERPPTAPARSRSASGTRARSITLLRNDDYWGDAGRRRRGRVPVLHRPQRRRQRAARRRRRRDHRRRLRAASASSRTTPTTSSRPARRTASSRSASTTPTRRCPTSGSARRSPRRSTRQGILELNNGYGTIIGAPGAADRPVVRGPHRPVPVRPRGGAGAARGGRLRRRPRPDVRRAQLLPGAASPTTSCPSSPTSASTSTCRPSSSRRGSSRCTPTTTTTSRYVLHVEPRDLDNYANPEYYWLYDNPEVQQLLADAEDRRPIPTRPTSCAARPPSRSPTTPRRSGCTCSPRPRRLAAGRDRATRVRRAGPLRRLSDSSSATTTRHSRPACGSCRAARA